MAGNIPATALKLIREADGLEIDLLSLQGLWTEAQYLRLTDQASRCIEFTEGFIEVLPMPMRQHQRYRATSSWPCWLSCSAAATQYSTRYYGYAWRQGASVRV